MEKEIEFAIQWDTYTKAGHLAMVAFLNRNFRETDDGEIGLNYWPAFDADQSIRALAELRNEQPPRFDVSFTEPKEHGGTTLVISVHISEIEK